MKPRPQSRVTLKPWDPKAGEYFKKEKSRLLKTLDGKPEIYHVGSTAVPGLGGKNIPDILVVVDDKKGAREAARIMESDGYYQTSEKGDEHRIFYNMDRKLGNKTVHIHAHIMWKTEDNYMDTILFRDYMRKHPEEAKRYYELKEKWAKEVDYIAGKFGKRKAGYVRDIVKKARKELRD